MTVLNSYISCMGLISIISLLNSYLSLQVKTRTLSIQLKHERKSQNTRLFAVGSDLIARPEDEDSPEFKEYLRQLMKMQATRAKTGFASPSSGSSDAYFAKLNRLKIERIKLREAGYPDAPLDHSYKEEDYRNAIIEGQEPLVTSAPLAAGSTGRNKVRALTPQEIDSARAAEENVQRMLANTSILKPKVVDTEVVEGSSGRISRASPYPKSNILSDNSPEMNVIDKLLKRSGINVGGASPEVNADVTPGKVWKPKQAPSPPAPAPAPAPVSLSSVPTVAVPAAVKSQMAAAPPPAPAPAPAPVPSPTPARTTASVTKPKIEAGGKRKLDKLEMDIAAQALQLLVKHRGGGAFGMGRLTGAEARSLGNSLIVARDMLNVDAIKAGPAAEVGAEEESDVGPTRSEDEKIVLPQLSAAKPAAAVPSASAVAPESHAAPPVVQPKAVPIVEPAPAAPKADSVPSPRLPQPQAGQPIPIAVGLDRFLADPKATSRPELEGLRDGIIQCLSLLQSELMSRPKDSSSEGDRAPSETVRDPTIRMLEQAQAQAPAAPASADPATMPLDREIKIALGLLVKHRGGPAFGHGRLEGKELLLLEEKLRSVSTRLLAEAKA